jgi:PAS domain-containing protein
MPQTTATEKQALPRKWRAPHPRPGFEHKAVPILVRWLLIILAFHQLAFSGTAAAEFQVAVEISYAYVASNFLLLLVPRRYFGPGPLSAVLTDADFAYIGMALFVLREPGAWYVWLLLASLVALAASHRLKQVLVGLAAALCALSIGTRAFSGSWAISHDTGDFLRAAILYSVVLLYYYVVLLLNRNATLFEIVLRGKQEWERTADAMSELILLLEPDGRIRRVNRALADHLHCSPAEVVGASIYQVLDGLPEPPPGNPFARMVAGREMIVERHSHHLLGHEAETLAIPVFEDGELTGGIYILRTVTLMTSYAAEPDHVLTGAWNLPHRS